MLVDITQLVVEPLDCDDQWRHTTLGNHSGKSYFTIDSGDKNDFMNKLKSYIKKIQQKAQPIMAEVGTTLYIYDKIKGNLDYPGTLKSKNRATDFMVQAVVSATTLSVHAYPDEVNRKYGIATQRANGLILEF